MCYDYYGGWSNTTGFNASLFHNQNDPVNWSTDKCVKLFINNKIDKYFKKPLDRIELNNDFDIIDLHMKIDEYRTNIKVRIC